MTPRDWTAGPIAVALCAALVAAGALWLSWDRWPRGTAQAALWAVLTAACVWRANRNLRAELDAARRLLDAWNSSEARDELAQSPPAGTLVVSQAVLDAMPRAEAEVFGAPLGNVFGMPVKASPFVPEGTAYVINPQPYDWATEPMTVAETDRLIGQLQALPGEDVIESTDIPRGQGLARLADVAQRLAACQGGDPDRIICTDTSCLGHGLVIDGPHHREAVARDGEGCICPWDDDHERLLARYPACQVHGQYFARPDGALHLGQPCNVCDAPSTAWVSDRPDPEVSDVTFLCDGCYVDRMSEEDGRG